jgi:outer membrane immunogenic protein
MQVKLAFLAAATLVVGGTHVASAADLLVKAPPPIFSWAGFYAGANAGFTFGDTTTTDTVATNKLCWISCGAQWGTGLTGFTGGGQAGYNWQFGNLVVGVEGDLGYLGARGSAAYPLHTSTIASTNGGLFATARGRVGFNIDHVLVYGTGGWFGANLDSNVSDSTGPVNINTSSTGFQSGWTAGGGVEWAFNPRWSLKGEYLHYDVGDKQVGGTFSGGGATIQFFNIKNTGDIVRFGANYHF